MKAVHLTGYGDPVENLELRDVAEPPAPGPGEALVGVEYAPINFNDLMVPWGTFPWHPETPAVIGNEGGGTVLAVGDGVTAVKPGDRVVLPITSGTWRERLVVPAGALAVVPSGADPRQAALLGINATTASLLLDDQVDLQPGDAIVYNAANSGLARWLVALARRKDVRTIGLIRRAADVEGVKAGGCDVVIVDDEPIGQAQTRISGLNVRLGLDVLAGPAAGRVFDLISPGGKLINYGAVTQKPLELSAVPLTFKGIAVEGFFLGMPETARKAFATLPALGDILAAERIEQPIAATYPIDGIKDALRHSLKGGRILLAMAAA